MLVMPVTEEVQPAKDTSAVVLTLEDALKVALSENISVKVADKEIQRAQYAKRGAYAALFPQIDASASFQRTIKKQVMYMDFDLGSMGGGAGLGGNTGADAGQTGGEISTKAGDKPSGGGFEVGRWNTWNAGVTASMPIVNAQLWTSLKISGEDVELAVEKARGSRLAMVTQVKKAFYAVLLSREACAVYERSYANAVHNAEVAEMKYNAQKISQMELVRAQTSVAAAASDVFNGRNTVDLSLWQLKAVLGVDLDMNIDIAGSIEEYTRQMFYDVHQNDSIDLSRNTSLKQMEIQLAELKNTIKLNQMAYVPSLAVMFNYSYNAMANDFVFSSYNWTPYSYVGLSLSIPIFSGGKRYHAVRQSKVQYEQVKLQQANTERQLKVAARSNINTMESNMNSFYAANAAKESAAKGYDITSKSYEVGRATMVELNDALLALEQTDLMRLQSVYNFLLAKSDLEEVLGQDYTQE